MNWARYWAGVLAPAFSLLSIVGAANAEPAQTSLQGKSILLNWTEKRTIVDARGRERVVPFAGDVAIYVSAKGRIFSRFRRRGVDDANNVSNGSEKDVTEQVLHWRFEGSTLAGYLTFVRGVRKISVEFAGDFKTCSMSTLYGKDHGASVIINSLTSGGDFELKGATIDSTDCQVREGNVFDTAN